MPSMNLGQMFICAFDFFPAIDEIFSHLWYNALERVEWSSVPFYIRVIYSSVVQIMAQAGNHESKNLQTA